MPLRRLALLALCSNAIACTVSPLPASTPAPAERSASAEEPRVRLVVEQYVHGLRFHDVASMRSAFDPDARLYWVKRDGSMGRLSQAEWYRGVAADAGREADGDLAIASMDVTGDVASAKVVETFSRDVSVDYLNLVRAGDEWRIVNRVNTRWSR